MTSTQMIVRTRQIRRGDTIVQQVPDSEHPYREVTVTEVPVTTYLTCREHIFPVRYLTGFDSCTQTIVKMTGTEHQTWQILRETD